MYLLSCDLSLNGTGLVVTTVINNKIEIVEYCFIDLSKKRYTHGQKLHIIHTAITNLLLKYNINVVAREKGFSRYAQATQTLYKVIGVSELCFYQNGVTAVQEYPPTTIKKAVTGSGKAEKHEVQTTLRSYLTDVNYVFESFDVSDAVAVALMYYLEKGVIK